MADITRLRYRASNTRINFLVSTGFNLQTYFAVGGGGADLDLTVQTVDGAHTCEARDRGQHDDREQHQASTLPGRGPDSHRGDKHRAIDFIIALHAPWGGPASDGN